MSINFGYSTNPTLTVNSLGYIIGADSNPTYLQNGYTGSFAGLPITIYLSIGPGIFNDPPTFKFSNVSIGTYILTVNG